MPPSPTAYPNDTAIFASNGLLNNPTGNYQINYKAILAWIRANCVQQTPGDGRPFPTQLRAANTLFYSSIPTDIPSHELHLVQRATADYQQPRSQQPFLEGIHRFRAGRLARSQRQHPGPRHLPPAATAPISPAALTAAAASASPAPIPRFTSTAWSTTSIHYQRRLRVHLGTRPSFSVHRPPAAQRLPGLPTSPPFPARKVTGVTVTNAGSGYSSAPTITFSAGGGTQPRPPPPVCKPSLS